MEPREPYDLVQWERWLFHLVHVRNLPGILKRGILCRNELVRRGVSYRSIADEEIQSRRRVKGIPCSPGTTIHDYVPLFFAARPPMLFAVRDKIPQRHLVYLLVPWSVLGRPGTVMTEGNASTRESRFFPGSSGLGELHLESLRAQYWGGDEHRETRRRKAAEVLVPGEVPVEEVQSIATMTVEGREHVAELVTKQGGKARVLMAPEWFY